MNWHPCHRERGRVWLHSDSGALLGLVERDRGAPPWVAFATHDKNATRHRTEGAARTALLGRARQQLTGAHETGVPSSRAGRGTARGTAGAPTFTPGITRGRAVPAAFVQTAGRSRPTGARLANPRDVDFSGLALVERLREGGAL